MISVGRSPYGQTLWLGETRGGRGRGQAGRRAQVGMEDDVVFLHHLQRRVRYHVLAAAIVRTDESNRSHVIPLMHMLATYATYVSAYTSNYTSR